MRDLLGEKLLRHVDRGASQQRDAGGIRGDRCVLEVERRVQEPHIGP
jgi:hypothetical protein